MKLISYNLRKNKAAQELSVLAERHDIDVLCLQEADTESLAPEIGELRLISATTQNRLGLALYARHERFTIHEARSFSLKKSMHDRILQPAHERLLAARVTDTEKGHDFVVASFHAAPLTALNSLRRHQINAALERLDLLGPGLPSLMVGDYNYPVFQQRLMLEMSDLGYDLSLSDARTYARYRMFTGHYDFATSTGFAVNGVNTLPQGVSDHLPILIQAEPKLVPIAA